MAKKSKIVKNELRRKMVARQREARAVLKARIADPSMDMAGREEAMAQLQKLPRDGSPTRIVNRCAMTGRPRAYYRKFGVSRIALRELALDGKLPGMVKASW